VLAAGGSTRYGQPKQLLEWMGESFVRMVAKTALDAGLDPVVVVTGAHADQVEAAVADLRVTIARNEEWMSGQGTSIRCGVQKVAPVAGSCIFLLVDQPQVNTLIVQALAEKHAKGLHPIVAPMVIDRRANPVLFDRVTFEDLTRLDGDVGGRAIFHKHSVEYVPWHDDRLLLDVDTPEQYQRLLADDTL
jgi:molybdenum cofactor cytidylyltransferase